jgi:hypothetical protein
MAAASLFLGLVALYENIDLRLHGQQASMELADPTRKITLPNGGYDVHMIDVRYVSTGKSIVVPQKRLSGSVARQVVSGAKVPITYYTNNTQHVLYGNEESANPWGWLVLGSAFLGIFVYALKLKRRESI